uniref:Uncharacterized protein n=1 Tax=Globisporangium ultimum (strain ATCC 200006 / CBS 805.95 / DAOM BR144) TaxID=431595 RepID=K3WKY2_GLOUD
MVREHIAYECRVMLYKAKYSGGYDDHYASKVQATYRMSAQRKTYSQMKYVRIRAARLLQALQRGIIARKRYVEMKIEREKYLLYGFRSSLHHSSVNMEDPKIRAKDMAEETERKRQAFLMQVLNGYVTEHDIPEPFRVPAELIQSLFNEFGVVVGCSTNFGDIVASYLRAATEQEAVDGAKGEAVESAARLYSSGQVNVALILGLRAQYDNTFGLCSTTRKLVAGNFALLPSDRQQQSDETSPPRWLLKVNPAFQRSNRNRLVVLRLSKKSAGRKSSHLVARDFRKLSSNLGVPCQNQKGRKPNISLL